MSKRSLIVQCSNSCPCVCPGCYNFFPGKQITCEELEIFINSYIDSFGLQKVTLSGGDPLLRSDIYKIINTFVERGVSVSMDTVGLPLLNQMDERLVSALRKVDVLGVPLDGVSDEVIQLFRRGLSFRQSENIIRQAQSLSRSVCVNTVAHARNATELDGIAKVLDHEPCVTKWQVFQFMPIGPGGFANRSFYYLEDEDFERIREEISRLILRETLEIEFKSIQSRRDKYIIIGCDGQVWIPLMNDDRRVLGSIFESDILKIIQDIDKDEKV